ncbi:hypothetical protein DMN91_008628 [Ooceraea biroi]|uniref:Uncharacterized protein n=1 Tax=Ooceraea biroi TaxID=2015173 RepID=A0A026WG14_OOCBI|nr:hypothetical protein X777_04455 [Ooceraea biroi]RLU18272.1 hypothetical protein DMN91_008628 [Ooceraea biroi]
MNCRFLCSIMCLILLLLLLHEPTESKKVVIHVPYRVKSVKHTHTIYKIIPPDYRKAKHENEDEHDDDYR